MIKKTLPTPQTGNLGEKTEKPKKLSKTGEWMKANPKGVIVIHDLRAILK
jgi:hypothetical protein